LRGISKNGHVWALTITITILNYHENECPTPFFWNAPISFMIPGRYHRIKRKRNRCKSLCFIKPCSHRLYWNKGLLSAPGLILVDSMASSFMIPTQNDRCIGEG
jgi:hypothetical protein